MPLEQIFLAKYLPLEQDDSGRSEKKRNGGASGMRKDRLFLPLFLAFAILLCNAPSISGSPRAEPLVILFTHDLHSHMGTYPDLDNGGNRIFAGGYARLATAVDRERSGRENRTLLVDAGDFSMGTVFHTVRETRGGELAAMGLLGYDATTYGNHDFEKGPGMLGLVLDAARGNSVGRLPALIASNTWVDPLEPGLSGLRDAQYAFPVLPYAVFRRAGMKIGLFGLMGTDAAQDVPQAAPVEFRDPAEAARDTVRKLREREKVDLVIALSHCGTWTDKSRSEDEILARSVKGIDVIVSGHTHTVLDPFIRVDGTLIVSAGAYCRYLGRLEIEKGTAGISVLDYRLIPIGPPTPEKPEVARFVARLAAEAEKTAFIPQGYRFGQVLAESAFSLPMAGDRVDPAAVPGTSGLGRLVTDAYRFAAGGSDLAFQAEGPIRAPLVKGPVTVNDVFRILSLGQGFDGQAGYPILAFGLRPRDIRDVFEVSPSIGPAKADARLEISGMRAVVDMGAPLFSRVKNVLAEKPNGSLHPLEEGCYRVVTNGYILLMMGFLEKASSGKLSVTPLDESGNLLRNPWSTRLLDPDGSEMKEWEALARFIQTFPDTNGNGVPDVPATYATPSAAFQP